MRGRRGGVRWVHLAVLLAIGLMHVGGMGAAEAYVMVPCAESPVFGAAGDHGRGLCYALKASMLGAPLAGELVLLCILLPLLAAARAGLYDRILGTVAGWHAVGMAGAALLFALNTPVATSSLVLAGCSILPPPAAAAEAPKGAGKGAAWCGMPGGDHAAAVGGELGGDGRTAAWCSFPASAHPVLFEKVSKMTGEEYFDPRSMRRLLRLFRG